MPTRPRSLERHLLTRLLAARDPLTTRFFGPPPVSDQGTPMAGDLHKFLRLVNSLNRASLHRHTPKKARVIYDDFTLAMASAPPMAVPTTQVTLPTRGGGQLPALVHRPESAPPQGAPAIVFFHGGGFSVGSARGYAPLASTFAHACQAVVFNVDYRLTPEHPFPAAPHDAIDAFEAILAQAPAHGIDPTRIALLGDSAGATLAGVVAVHCATMERPGPCHQMLVYPVAEHAGQGKSRETFGRGFLLCKEDLKAYGTRYIPQPAALSPHAPWMHSLLRLPARLPGLAPMTVVTAGFDPLRDEGGALVDKVQKMGHKVEHLHYGHLCHGFFTLGGLLHSAKEAVDELGVLLGQKLHP